MKGNGEAITFGDQVLDKSDYQNVAFMNDGNAMRVIIPVTVDPKGSGKMVPDLKFMEENKELLDLIQKKKNLEDPEVKKNLQKLISLTHSQDCQIQNDLNLILSLMDWLQVRRLKIITSLQN